MPIVLDASVCACWLIPDEDDPIAAMAYQLLKSDIGYVPAIWWFEIRNILVTNERRGRISVPQVDRGLSLLARMTINIDQSPNEPEILRLARGHRLSVYDAAYLELAKRLSLPLATFDRALQRALQDEDLLLFGH